jgi:hypothetical protein
MCDVLIKLIVEGGILLLPPDDLVIIQLCALFLQECILAGLNVALAEGVCVPTNTHPDPDPTAHLALLSRYLAQGPLNLGFDTLKSAFGVLLRHEFSWGRCHLHLDGKARIVDRGLEVTSLRLIIIRGIVMEAA